MSCDDVAAWWNCWLSTLSPSLSSLSQFPDRVSNATISVANVENCHHSTRLLAQVRPLPSCPSSCSSIKVVTTIILQPRHHQPVNRIHPGYIHLCKRHHPLHPLQSNTESYSCGLSVRERKAWKYLQLNPFLLKGLRTLFSKIWQLIE